jgi:hypothetical protein
MPNNTTEAERKERRREVVDLIFQGHSYAEIASELDISKGTVHNDVEHMQEKWEAEAIRAMDKHMRGELARLRRIWREAWTAWRESLEQPWREKVKKVGKGESRATVDEVGEIDAKAVITDLETITKEITRRAGGNPQYLRLALQAEREILGLLGLDDYDAGRKERHMDPLIDAIEATAEETDFEEEFGDEEIR